MRRLIRIVIVAAMSVVISCSGSQSRETEATATALADIEQQLIKLWLDGDREAYSALLAPDWSVIDMTGRVLTKEQVMEEAFAPADRKIETATIDDVKVRAFDDMAIVTGRTVVAGTFQGTRVSLTHRFTDVFARRNGRWQVVASQATPIKQ